MRGMTEDEARLLAQVTMYGSAAYPVERLSRGWSWGPWLSVSGPPTIFKTKREATRSFEAFINVLLDAKAGRL